jgi:ABC-type nitrate/sulfonate/bicarbonate transport system ATPase subunit
MVSMSASMPFTPVALSFQNMSYSVSMPDKSTRKLLNDITGYALPGTMTALMGSSGAGKTTLMDVISGRKTGGNITGTISVNGQPKNDEMFRRITGYVEQNDIHDPYTTVREGLRFAAKLVRCDCVGDVGFARAAQASSRSCSCAILTSCPRAFHVHAAPANARDGRCDRGDGRADH